MAAHTSSVDTLDHCSDNQQQVGMMFAKFGEQPPVLGVSVVGKPGLCPTEAAGGQQQHRWQKERQVQQQQQHQHDQQPQVWESSGDHRTAWM